MLITYGLLACGNQNEGDGEPLARAHDIFLYREEVQKIIPKGINSADSTAIAEKYIDEWIKKQLLMHEASQSSKINEDEINRRTEEYRFQLMSFEYIKDYVEASLDTTITPDEIQRYYEENKADYELREDIIKGYFAKVSKEAPQISDLRKLIRSQNEEDLEKLKGYCSSYAEKYSLSDSAWVSFSQITAETPIQSENSRIASNRCIEKEDDTHIYLLYINEVRRKTEASPLEFVREKITAAILNKRKVNLQEKLKTQIYQKAKTENVYEIFTTKQ